MMTIDEVFDRKDLKIGDLVYYFIGYEHNIGDMPCEIEEGYFMTEAEAINMAKKSTMWGKRIEILEKQETGLEPVVEYSLTGEEL